MTHPQQQLIKQWREMADEPSELSSDWTPACDRVLRTCANQLEAALSAGAVPQQEPQDLLTELRAKRWSVPMHGHSTCAADPEVVNWKDIEDAIRKHGAGGSLRVDGGTGRDGQPRVGADHSAAHQPPVAAIPALPAPQEPECDWTHDEDDIFGADVWESACGETWQFLDGGPKENRALFCHGCGKRIRINNGTFSNKDTNA